MKLLLDTHCLIWLVTDAPQLGADARRRIDGAEGVWFSDASVWELGLKWRKGKIALQPRRPDGRAFARPKPPCCPLRPVTAPAHSSASASGR